MSDTETEMSGTPDGFAAFDEATLDEARSSLPIFIVADSPDGDVLSHEGGYPGDDTKVWLAKGGNDADPSTMGDLYAEYGDDLIAYAEPEETGVTASLSFLEEYADASLADLTPAEQIEAVGTVAFPDRQVAEAVAAAVHDPSDENLQAAIVALEGAADEWLTAKQDNGQPVTASMVMDELIGDANGLSTLKGWDLTFTETTLRAGHPPTFPGDTVGYVPPPFGFPTAEETIDRYNSGLISFDRANELLAPLIPEPNTVNELWAPGGAGQRAVNPIDHGITAAMGHQAIERLEGFLGMAEDLLGITAAMAGPGIVSRQTARMAVGDNSDAQAEVVAAFNANYTGDVNRFVETVLGPPPAPNADHDEEAYDALAREARLWHARHTASIIPV